MEHLENNNFLFSIFKGILISFLFTVVMLTIFATILVYTNLSEQIIPPVIITVTGISILVGSSMGTRKLRRRGLLNGAIIGLIYILLLYLISSAVNCNFSINIMSILMALSGMVGGTIGGIIGVNTKK